MADLDTVQKIFRAADQDNGGTLDKNELKKLFLETSCIIIGREISEEDGAKWAAECIKQSSTNGATVTMAEFHHFMHTNANLFGPVFLWYDVFSHYATGGSGDTPIHLDEHSALNMVKEIFKRRNVALSEAQALGQVKDMMQLADKDPLTCAAQIGSSQCTQLLLTAPNTSLATRRFTWNNAGNSSSPVYDAAYSGSVEMVKELLKHGCVHDNKTIVKSLCIAARRGNLPVFQQIWLSTLALQRCEERLLWPDDRLPEVRFLFQEPEKDFQHNFKPRHNSSE